MMFDWFSFLLYLLVFVDVFWGFRIAKHDSEFGKISNRQLGLFALFVFIWYLFIFALGLVDTFFYDIKNFNPPLAIFYYLTISGTIISLFVGYAMWKFGVWAAGDAKFFTVISFAIPPVFYKFVEIGYYPGFSLLINIFLLSFFYIFLKSLSYLGRNIIFWLKRHELITSFLKSAWSFNRKKILISIVNLLIVVFIFSRFSFYLNFVLQSLFKYFNVFYSRIFLTLILFGTYSILRKFLAKKNMFYISFGLLLFLEFLYIRLGQGIMGDLFFSLRRSFGYFVFVGLIELMIDYYLNGRERLEISCDNLQAGMMLTGDLIKNIPKEIIGYGAEGLESEQMESLKKYLKESKIETVSTYKPWRFAPWIFSGMILTLITRQSLITLLIRFHNYVITHTL